MTIQFRGVSVQTYLRTYKIKIFTSERTFFVQTYIDVQKKEFVQYFHLYVYTYDVMVRTYKVRTFYPTYVNVHPPFLHVRKKIKRLMYEFYSKL